MVDGILFSLADGLRVEKVADQPLIKWPIVADWDSHGRLVVAESGGVSGSVALIRNITEHRRLEYLIGKGGVVLSKAQILDHVWGHDHDGTENVVELYVGYLRRKLDDDHPQLIHTRRGLGYVLREGPR